MFNPNVPNPEAVRLGIVPGDQLHPQEKAKDTIKIKMSGADTAVTNAGESPDISTPANAPGEEALPREEIDKIVAQLNEPGADRTLILGNLPKDQADAVMNRVRELKHGAPDIPPPPDIPPATPVKGMSLEEAEANAAEAKRRAAETAPTEEPEPVAAVTPPAAAAKDGGAGKEPPEPPPEALPAPEPQEPEGPEGPQPGQPPERTRGEALNEITNQMQREAAAEAAQRAIYEEMDPQQREGTISSLNDMNDRLLRSKAMNIDPEREEAIDYMLQKNLKLIKFIRSIDEGGEGAGGTKRTKVTAEQVAEERRILEQEKNDRKELSEQPADVLRNTLTTDRATLKKLRESSSRETLSPAKRLVLDEEIQRLEARQEIANDLLPAAEAEEAENFRQGLEDKSIDDLSRNQGQLQDRIKELQKQRRKTPEQIKELQNAQRQEREVGDALNRKKAEEVEEVDTTIAKENEKAKVNRSNSTEIFREVEKREPEVDKLRNDIKSVRDQLNAEGTTGEEKTKLTNKLYELTKRLQGEEEILGMYRDALYKSDAEFRAMDKDQRSDELLKIGQEIDLNKYDYDDLRGKALRGENLTKEQLAALGAKMAGKFIEKGAKSMFNSDGVSLAEMRKIFALRPELQKYVADRLIGDKGFEEMVKDKIPNAQKLLRWAKNNPAWLMVILAILAGVVAGPASVAIGAAQFGTSKKGLFG